MTKITAGRGTLDLRDVIQGLLVAVGTPVITIILDSISAGNFDINWKHIGGIAVAAFLGYLLKQFTTPSKVVISDPATVQAAKEGETITVTPKPQQ